MAKLLGVMAAAIGLVACNPLITDPVSLGGELEQTSARYAGPSPAWLEVAVSGAPGHVVYALALVNNADLHGPAERSCAGAGMVPCEVTVTDVRMPGQRIVAGDGSQRVRLMTVWSGETAQVILVCVDPVTQELGCPAGLKTALRTVDVGGALIGDLVPGA